jgi:hypothetical protein
VHPPAPKRFTAQLRKAHFNHASLLGVGVTKLAAFLGAYRTGHRHAVWSALQRDAGHSAITFQICYNHKKKGKNQ